MKDTLVDTFILGYKGLNELLTDRQKHLIIKVRTTGYRVSMHPFSVSATILKE